MIGFINGTLDSVTDTSVLIEANGIGYEIFISTSTLSNLPKISENVKIYTHMSVKEDGVTLFGFLTREELNMFKLLNTVSGIGPKVAMSALSSLKPDEIMIAIVTEDLPKLSKISGLGKKTSGRLVLELKDKIKTDSIIDLKDPQQKLSTEMKSAKQDAIDALLALGYTRSEALRAVLEVFTDGMTTEQIIKQTLRKLNS